VEGHNPRPIGVPEELVSLLAATPLEQLLEYVFLEITVPAGVQTLEAVRDSEGRIDHVYVHLRLNVAQLEQLRGQVAALRRVIRDAQAA
jgi:hypothetical protein